MRSGIVRLALTAIVGVIAFLLVVNVDERDGNIEEMLSGIGDGNIIKATEAMEALRWYNNQRAYPVGEIPVDWREKALTHTQSFNMSKSSSDSTVTWQSVGPSNIGGRVRSIAIDPTNPNIIYSGSVSGGLWKSTDSGNSWVSLTDFAPNLVIGCIAIDPVNTQIVYAGTGEGFFNSDALRGVGVLKSTNGGSSWTVLNSFSGSTSAYAYYFINKILIRPDNPNTIFVATSSTTEGIWKSTNAGVSWSRMTAPGNLSKFCVDLEMDPTSPDIMYGAFGLFAPDGIYKTTNGGTNWSKLTNGFPSTSTKYGRISLAIAPSNTATLYAVLADSNYYTHSVMKSTDAGTSWFSVTTPYDNSSAVSGTHLGGQGWYNNEVVVHPTNPDIVYVGGINLLKTTNGGSTWGRISDGYGSPYVHVDQHAIAFHPTNPSIMYFGNDGGIFKSTDGGSSFVSLNSGFTTVQFYSGAVHPTSNIYFGGTQDNGTLKSGTIPQWSQTFGGDGGATWVDYNTPTTVFTEYVNLCIQKSTNSGAVGTWVKTMNGIPTTSGQGSGTTDRCSFIAPFVMDPSNPLILVAGTYKVYRTTNSGGLWTAISSDLTGSGIGADGATITALAIAKSSSSTIYVGTSGSATDSSRVIVSQNSFSTWVNLTKSPLPNRYVTSIAVNPSSADSVYVAYSGYNAATPTTPGHLFLTQNGGSTWTNISGDLPDIPVNTILLDSADPRHLLVGTDLGIYETVNGGSNWIQRNVGMANVAIADLDLNNNKYVFAATHGRGMFKTLIPFVGNSDTQTVAPLTFTLSAPADGSTGQAIAGTLSWRASDHACGYDVYLGTTNPPISRVSSSQAETTYYYSGLAYNTVYFWKVIARNRIDSTIASGAPWEFTTLEPSASFSLVSPINGQTNQPINGTLSWQAPEYLKYFDVYLDTSPQPSTPISIDIPNTTYPYTDLSNNTVYYWYVRAKNEDGVIITVSDLWSFVTMGNIPLAQNYPNPFRDTTNLEFTLTSSGIVTIHIYNFLGQEINTPIRSQLYPQGRSRIRFDGSGLPSGIYFYRIIVQSTEDKKAVFTDARKMLLVK